MTVSDAIVIGGGPAGRAAVLALSRLRRTSILFDSEEYRNNPHSLPASPMHTVPLADGMPVFDYHRKTWAEIEKYGVAKLVKKKITLAKKETDGQFTVTDIDQHTYRARKLIICTGATDLLPKLPGVEELWATSIGACPFCHGFEQVDKKIAMWQPLSPLHINAAATWSTLTREPVYLLLNGASVPEPAKSAFESLTAHGHHVVDDPVEKFEPIDASDKLEPGVRVHFKTSRSPLEIGFLVMGGPTSQKSSEVVKSLGLEVDQMGNIKIFGEMFQETSVKGVYAAGDCSGLIKHVSQAIATGNAAGSAVVFELVREDLRINIPPASEIFAQMMKGPPPSAQTVDSAASASIPVPKATVNGQS